MNTTEQSTSVERKQPVVVQVNRILRKISQDREFINNVINECQRLEPGVQLYMNEVYACLRYAADKIYTGPQPASLEEELKEILLKGRFSEFALRALLSAMLQEE